MTNILGTTKVVGIVGHPVVHSLSPVMQNAAFQHLGLDYVDIPLDVQPERLPEALKGISALGMVGTNVTIPHKERVAELVDELTEEARLIGAVNTVTVKDGRLVGDNTDGRGFLKSLLEAGFDPKGKKAVLLGAGGAARAVAFCLARAGVMVQISNRTEARAESLSNSIESALGAGHSNVIPFNTDSLFQSICKADLLVNTTPVGMLGIYDDQMPIPPECFHDKLFVYDVIYIPFETPLIEAARKNGLQTLSGIKMLVHQGAIAFETWTGEAAPLEIMESAVTSYLTAR